MIRLPQCLTRLGRRATPLGIVLTVVFANSCNTVTQGTLVGDWTLTAASRQHLPANLHDVATRVNLQSDGAFIAVDLPDKRVESSGVFVFTKSGSGTWKVLMFAGKERVELFFADGSGAEFNISNALLAEPTLYYFLTDPDSGPPLELVRLR